MWWSSGKYWSTRLHLSFKWTYFIILYLKPHLLLSPLIRDENCHFTMKFSKLLFFTWNLKFYLEQQISDIFLVAIDLFSPLTFQKMSANIQLWIMSVVTLGENGIQFKKQLTLLAAQIPIQVLLLKIITTLSKKNCSKYFIYLIAHMYIFNIIVYPKVLPASFCLWPIISISYAPPSQSHYTLVRADRFQEYFSFLAQIERQAQKSRLNKIQFALWRIFLKLGLKSCT